jgi:hypothetical protein
MRHRGDCEGTKGAPHRLWYSAKVSRRRTAEISLDRSDWLRLIRNRRAKEKQDATTLLSQPPVAISAVGEFNKRFRECCEKAKLTSNLRFSCASFTQGGRAGAQRPCRRDTTGNARALSPGIGRETIGVCAYAQLPSRDRCRLASAAWFYPAASGLGFGRA